MAPSSFVLLVHPDPPALAALVVAFARAGLDARVVSDVAAAAPSIAGGRTRVVVVDLDLDVEGPTAPPRAILRALRGLPGGDELTLLAMSAAPTPEQVSAALVHGADAVVTRTKALDELVESVRAHAHPRARLRLVRRGVREIIAVDDDPWLLELMTVRLAGAGFDVTPADGVSAALRIARRSPPDAFVSDVLMPELDGFDLARAVRRHPQLAHVHVVLVSSNYVEAADRALARDMGAADLVERTPRLENVIAALAACSGRNPPVVRAPDDWLDAEHVDRSLRQLDLQVVRNGELVERRALLETELYVLSIFADALCGAGGIEPALDAVLATCLGACGAEQGALYL